MSVFNTSVTTVFLGPYLTAVAEEAAGYLAIKICRLNGSGEAGRPRRLIG